MVKSLSCCVLPLGFRYESPFLEKKGCLTFNQFRQDDSEGRVFETIGVFDDLVRLHHHCIYILVFLFVLGEEFDELP